MAVPIRATPDGKAIEPGISTSLFATNLGRRYAFRQRYVVLPNSQSFVMESLAEDGSTSPITVIINWKPTR